MGRSRDPAPRRRRCFPGVPLATYLPLVKEGHGSLPRGEAACPSPPPIQPPRYPSSAREGACPIGILPGLPAPLLRRSMGIVVRGGGGESRGGERFGVETLSSFPVASPAGLRSRVRNAAAGRGGAKEGTTPS